MSRSGRFEPLVCALLAFETPMFFAQEAAPTAGADVTVSEATVLPPIAFESPSQQFSKPRRKPPTPTADGVDDHGSLNFELATSGLGQSAVGGFALGQTIGST